MHMRNLVPEAGISGGEKSLHPTLLCGKQSDQRHRLSSIFQHFYSLYFKVGYPITIYQIRKELERLSLLICISFPLYTSVSLSVQIPMKRLSHSCRHYASRWPFQHRYSHTYMRNIMKRLGTVKVCFRRNDWPLGYCKSNAITLKASVNSISDPMSGHCLFWTGTIHQ